jgi:hypothetical protein
MHHVVVVEALILKKRAMIFMEADVTLCKTVMTRATPGTSTGYSVSDAGHGDDTRT